MRRASPHRSPSIPTNRRRTQHCACEATAVIDGSEPISTQEEHDASEEIADLNQQSDGGAEPAPPPERGDETGSRVSEKSLMKIVKEPQINTVRSEEIDSISVETLPSTPTDQDVLEAGAYVSSVPTRLERAKIRTRRRRGRGRGTYPVRGNAAHQVKCANTRSSSQLHHASSVKAVKMKALLKLPGVKSRLIVLHTRRPVYKPPATEGCVIMTEVPWPTHVRKIDTCETKGVRFPDLGAYHKCRCVKIVSGTMVSPQLQLARTMSVVDIVVYIIHCS
ncbi:hypothetical protein GQ600_6030 [Phytophthora cactorum]|nr:hypothetical protein GQ600_6030 [Phytophthora cactorum]